MKLRKDSLSKKKYGGGDYKPRNSLKKLKSNRTKISRKNRYSKRRLRGGASFGAYSRTAPPPASSVAPSPSANSSAAAARRDMSDFAATLPEEQPDEWLSDHQIVMRNIKFIKPDQNEISIKCAVFNVLSLFASAGRPILGDVREDYNKLLTDPDFKDFLNVEGDNVTVNTDLLKPDKEVNYENTPILLKIKDYIIKHIDYLKTNQNISEKPKKFVLIKEYDQNMLEDLGISKTKDKNDIISALNKYLYDALKLLHGNSLNNEDKIADLFLKHYILFLRGLKKEGKLSEATMFKNLGQILSGGINGGFKVYADDINMSKLYKKDEFLKNQIHRLLTKKGVDIICLPEADMFDGMGDVYGEFEYSGQPLYYYKSFSANDAILILSRFKFKLPPKIIQKIEAIDHNARLAALNAKGGAAKKDSEKAKKEPTIMIKNKYWIDLILVIKDIDLKFRFVHSKSLAEPSNKEYYNVIPIVDFILGNNANENLTGKKKTSTVVGEEGESVFPIDLNFARSKIIVEEEVEDEIEVNEKPDVIIGDLNMPVITNSIKDELIRAMNVPRPDGATAAPLPPIDTRPSGGIVSPGHIFGTITDEASMTETPVQSTEEIRPDFNNFIEKMFNLTVEIKKKYDGFYCIPNKNIIPKTRTTDNFLNIQAVEGKKYNKRSYNTDFILVNNKHKNNTKLYEVYPDPENMTTLPENLVIPYILPLKTPPI